MVYPFYSNNLSLLYHSSVFFIISLKEAVYLCSFGGIYIYTVEQIKFGSAIISRIRELASPSRSYRTRSIRCLVTLFTTGGDGASVGEFQP